MVWSSVPIGGTYGLTALWASGPKDAWATGNGQSGSVMLHWDGKAWSTSSTSLSAISIWGLDAGDIWAVGAGGVILRYSIGTGRRFPHPQKQWAAAGFSRRPNFF